MVEAKTVIGLIVVAILIVAPIVMYSGHGEDDGYFGGSDDQGGEAIEQMDPNYEVWAQPLWEPPSGEIESLIFCLEAGIGGLIVGYVFGKWKGQDKSRKKE